MLGDPKKLKTRAGHGYLVSWKDRLRVEGDARALVARILDDPQNVAALRQARADPAASMDELASWLSSGLAGGAFALLRTEEKPPPLRIPPAVDLRDLIDGRLIGGNTPEPEHALTFVSVEVVDTQGRRPGAGELRLALGGGVTTHIASERIHRGKLRAEAQAAAQAAAGCLELDFHTAAGEHTEPRPPLPVEPPPTLSASVTFEVVSPTGEPLELGYRVTAGDRELATGRTAATTTIPAPGSPDSVQLELLP